MLKGALCRRTHAVPRPAAPSLDEAAFEPYAEFLLAGASTAMLAGGTTGEGILQTPEERMRGIALFARSGLTTIAHCGAQTTADDRPARGRGGRGGRRGGRGDRARRTSGSTTEALLAHFTAAARAARRCLSTSTSSRPPRATRSSLEVVSRLRDRAPNFVGLKVSDAPWDAFCAVPDRRAGRLRRAGGADRPGDGVRRGRRCFGLAAAFPERVAAAVARPDGPDAAALGELRAVRRAVPAPCGPEADRPAARGGHAGDVRLPLRQLTDDERHHARRLARRALLTRQGQKRLRR